MTELPTEVTSPESITRALRDLVRTAVGAQGPRGFAERLSVALEGWVLLIDADGAPRAAVPESSRAYLNRVLAEIPRAGARAPIAAAISLPGESVSITSVSVAGRVRGYVAVGRSSSLSAAEHTVVETATYLIAEDLRRADEIRQGARNNRQAVLRLLLGGHVREARSTGEILGVKVPEGPVRVAVLTTTREHATDLVEAVEDDQALRRIDTVSAVLRPGRVALILPTAEGDLRTLEAILRRVPNCRGAASEAVSVDDLPDAWRRVRAVLQAASDEPGHLYFARDVSEAGLLRHLAGDDVRAWAQSALLPVLNLTSGSKVDYLETLRAFLANNGQADASASSLGIHRHTLRYRMTKIAEALDRDLDDPTVRAELWLAFKLHAAQ